MVLYGPLPQTDRLAVIVQGLAGLQAFVEAVPSKWLVDWSKNARGTFLHGSDLLDAIFECSQSRTFERMQDCVKHLR